MKRKLAWILILALSLMLLPAAGVATEEGEMLLTSEAVTGAVGDIVKVDFYCYPNLPDGQLLDSLEGTLEYDPELLTLGSINLRDEEQNLSSLLNSKGPIWIPNTTEAGKLVFAWVDTFGTDVSGFLFQLEFRIEKEGAAAFVFNGVRYSGLDESTNKAVSYFVNPVQLGGVYTEGYEIPTELDPDVTYAPLEAAVETAPPQATATPKPNNNGQTVPNTTALPDPTLSSSPNTDLGTPKPQVTSVPLTTHNPTGSTGTTAPDSSTTAEPAANTEATTVPNTEEPVLDTTEQPNVVAEATPESSDTPIRDTELTPAPETVNPNPTVQQPNRALVIAVIAGIAVVILLAVLAIVLILIRNKRMNEQD